MSRTRRKPWLLPKPHPLPDGYMLFHQRLTPIEDVEAYADSVMRGFDTLPPATRFALNVTPAWPHRAAVEVARRGDRAASESIIKMNWSFVFKTKDRSGVHP